MPIRSIRYAQGVALSLLTLGFVAPITQSTTPHAEAASAVDGPITRTEILSRAQTWIDQHVPYCQCTQGYTDPQGAAYRNDCSGFVDMALHLGQQPNTEGLPAFLDPIGWEQLLPGDIVGTLGAGSGGDNGHVVIFNGWANPEHTVFNSLEEQGGAGAIRTTESKGFQVGSLTAQPYRYKKVVNDGGGSTSSTGSSFEAGRIVSARSADGRLETFAAASNGIYHAWQNQVNGTWSTWSLIGGPTDAKLSLVPNADGRLELFALNGSTFSHTWQTTPNGNWSAWTNFGGGGFDQAAGVNADGRIEVFASNSTGIFHRWQTTPGQWSAWTGTGGGPVNSHLAIESNGDGRLEVFALNGSTFSNLWQTAPSGGWSAWGNFGSGGVDLTADHNADGRLEVFASNGSGVTHRWQTAPGQWSAWTATGGPANSQLSSQRTADGRVEVFAINGSTAAHSWQTGLNAPYSAWETFGTSGTDIQAAPNQDGRIEVFASNPTGMFHKWQTGFSTWSNWGWLNNAGPGQS